MSDTFVLREREREVTGCDAGGLRDGDQWLDAIQLQPSHAGDQGRSEERKGGEGREIYRTVQVLVDAPCPDVKKENAFEDTLFLIDILRQTKAKENKQKKVAFTINITLIQV